MAEAGIHFLPANLENPMVFAGAYALVAVVVMIVFSRIEYSGKRFGVAALATAMILWLGAVSPSAVALLVLIGTAFLVGGLMLSRRAAAPNLWDYSMLKTHEPAAWYASLWLWWSVLSLVLVGIYVWLW